VIDSVKGLGTMLLCELHATVRHYEQDPCELHQCFVTSGQVMLEFITSRVKDAPPALGTS
jgi:hypothetical protein